MSVRQELESEGHIKQWKGKVFDHEGWKFKALTPPSPNVFTSEEKAVIDYWIKHVDEDHTATSISDLSHNYGWEIARMGERIPFHSLLAERVREPNEDELQWAKPSQPMCFSSSVMAGIIIATTLALSRRIGIRG